MAQTVMGTTSEACSSIAVDLVDNRQAVRSVMEPALPNSRCEATTRSTAITEVSLSMKDESHRRLQMDPIEELVDPTRQSPFVGTASTLCSKRPPAHAPQEDDRSPSPCAAELSPMSDQTDNPVPTTGDGRPSQPRLPSTTSTQEGHRSPNSSEPAGMWRRPPPMPPSAIPPHSEPTSQGTSSAPPEWVEPLVRGEGTAAAKTASPSATATRHLQDNRKPPDHDSRTPTRRIFAEESPEGQHHPTDGSPRTSAIGSERLLRKYQQAGRPMKAMVARIDAPSPSPPQTKAQQQPTNASDTLLVKILGAQTPPSTVAVADHSRTTKSQVTTENTSTTAAWLPPPLPTYWSAYCTSAASPSRATAAATLADVATTTGSYHPSASPRQHPDASASFHRIAEEERSVDDLRRCLHTQEGLVKELLLAREQVRLAVTAQQQAVREAAMYREALESTRQEVIELEKRLHSQHQRELEAAQDAFEAYDARFNAFLLRLQEDHAEDERRWQSERRYLHRQLGGLYQSMNHSTAETPSPTRQPLAGSSGLFTRDANQRRVDRHAAAKRPPPGYETRRAASSQGRAT